MNTLIVILVLAWLSMLLLASAGSLWLLSIWFKMPAPTYKKSLIIIAVICAVGGVVGLAESAVGHFGGFDSRSVITTLVCIELLHYLFQKFYQAHWPKTLGILAIQAVVTICLSGVLIALVRFFMFMPVYVTGEAMSPTYHDKDYLLVNKITDDFARSEIVVYKQENRFIIGRVIGLPGEKIEIKNGQVLVNNQPLSEPYVQGVAAETVSAVVGNDHYFVLADNRSIGKDSRTFGPILEENIVGKVFYERPSLTK